MIIIHYKYIMILYKFQKNMTIEQITTNYQQLTKCYLRLDFSHCSVPPSPLEVKSAPFNSKVQ